MPRATYPSRAVLHVGVVTAAPHGEGSSLSDDGSAGKCWEPLDCCRPDPVQGSVFTPQLSAPHGPGPRRILFPGTDG